MGGLPSLRHKSLFLNRQELSMKKSRNFSSLRCFGVKIEPFVLGQIVRTFIFVLIFGVGAAQPARAELTKAQAITRVKTILRNNTSACRINKIRNVSAVRVRAGWRITARITMSASGEPLAETAVWIVSAKNGASSQNQLTAEIEMGCP